MGRSTRRRPRQIRSAAIALSALLTLLGSSAHADPPSAGELAKEVGLSDSDIAKALDGKFVLHSLESSNPRELTAGIAFVIEGVTPSELVDRLQIQGTDDVDPNVVAYHFVGSNPQAKDFAELKLPPGLVKAFLKAKPGDSLNLSAEEIAGLRALGDSADADAVEKKVRSLLMARLRAYQERGLAGLAPYARKGDEVRSIADDLRSATEAVKLLPKHAPNARGFLLDYPKGKPQGTRETFRWTFFIAHDEPTLALTHGVAIPDGDVWIAAQRQFYVSAGYNCEQAIAAFVPIKQGTGVFYGNRTSTDQVTGFGGGAKRSIGSKLLASQLEDLFEKLRVETEDAEQK